MARVWATLLLGLAVFGTAGEEPARAEPAMVAPKPNEAKPAGKSKKQRATTVLRGEAAFYSDAFAGRPTASGEPYAPEKLTAAHRTLPLGSVIQVTREDDGRSVQVRVNDRGPYGKKSRIVDLSRAAAERLGMLKSGVARVRVEVVGRHKP